MDKYQQTFDTWNKLAGLYQEKFMHLDLYNESYDQLCQSLPTKAEVLDVGCGPGNITRYCLNKRPDLHITGIDTAPAMIELAKQNNPAANFQLMDAREIKALHKSFDAIIAGFCIPYLDKKDLRLFLESCATVLNTGGCLYLSFVEGEHDRSGIKESSSGDSVLFHYYTLVELRQFLASYGFVEQGAFETPYPNQPVPDLHRMLLLTLPK
jgi:ubiquinone/menaquinone biosynthesis C-methylase UbiE